MSTGMHQGWHSVGAEELRQSWAWFLGLGIVLVLLGLLALLWAVVATLVSVVIFGWLLLFGGVLSVLHAFLRRRWGGFLIELFAGLLYVIVGLLIVGNPAASAVALTLFIAFFLLIGGLFRVVAALTVRFHHWVCGIPRPIRAHLRPKSSSKTGPPSATSCKLVHQLARPAGNQATGGGGWSRWTSLRASDRRIALTS